MKCSRKLSLLSFLLFSFTPCFAHHMAVVVNKDNNTGEITSAHLSKLFRLETRKWGDGKDVVVVLHKDSSGEALTLEHLNKISGDELKSFISSHKDSFIFVDTDADVLRFVETTPGAVGLVEVHSIDNQVNVLKVDGKLPMEAGYLPH
jgi:ABC-type phosphate transport system substrate-binding protein